MKKFTLIFIPVLAVLASLMFILHPSAVRATISFNSNDLMEDGVFTNTNTMSAAQIDVWLNSNFPSSCISTNNGFTAPDPTGYTPSAGFTYGGNVSAGQVIYDAAQAYGINPQVLLATLQKESSVVSGDASYHCQYINTAMGYGCPDSGACPTNPATMSGFSKQVIHAAWLFMFGEQRSKGNTSWNIQKTNQPQAGDVWNNSDDPQTCYGGPMTQGSFKRCSSDTSPVYYDGSYTIDGTSVQITTGATAALYWYTPHFSGNQNFDNIFTNWFGSTIGNLVMAPGGGVYKIESGVKRAFPSEIIFQSYSYKLSDVVTISSAELPQIPDGTAMPYNAHFRDGHLVTSSAGGVYDVDSGQKRPFPNEATFLSYGYTYADALVISAAEINLIPDGAAMTYNVHLRDGHLVTSPSGGVYVIENGAKRPFPNELTFFSYGYTYADALVISAAELSLIPDGTAMPYNAHFRDGHLVTSSAGGVYDVDSGQKRPFPNEATFLSYGYTYADALVISAAEINLIPDGAAMPLKS